MKVPTLVGATLLGFILAGVAPTTSIHAQQRRRTAAPVQRTCVEFSQEHSSDGRTITMELTNHCDHAVESRITWRLVCGDTGTGTPIERNERMQPNEQRVVVADVQACGSQPYRIDNLRWNWRPENVSE